MSALAALVAFLCVPGSPVRSRERFSPAPAGLLTAWLVALVLGVSDAPRSGWTSPRVIGLLVAATVRLAAWPPGRSSSPGCGCR